MPRDFAKGGRRSGTATRKPAASRRADAPSPKVWRWYFSGVISGVLGCLALYLVTLPADPMNPATAEAPASDKAPANTPPKPRFDFYTMLPDQKIDVAPEPGAQAPPPQSSQHRTRAAEVYLLQAGSFRAREDADRRRAELLLLGLEPRIEESSTDNGRWFRVFIGPFDSHSRMARARSLAAGQDIDTLLLKRPG
jgi:cell division protein FtsN